MRQVLVVGVVAAFYLLFGLAAVVRYVLGMPYMRFRGNGRFVARVAGLHLGLGIVTALGAVPYAVVPSLPAASVAAVAAGGPVALLTVKTFPFAVGQSLTRPRTLGALGITGAVAAALLLGGLVLDSVLLVVAWLGLGGVLGAVGSAHARVSQDWPGGEPADGEQKNVVVCMVDDVRRDRLSAYGYDRSTSPFLERLRERALVFENCVSPGVRSGHSIPSLLSGAPATVHQYCRNLEDIRLLSDEFADAGYVTGAVSSNPHVVPSRFDSRFHWFAYVDTGKQYLFVLQRLLARLVHALSLGYLPIHYFVMDAAFANELGTGFVDAAVQEGRPFFLYFSYMDVHEPYLREFEHVSAFAADHGETVSKGPWMRNTEGRKALWYDEELKRWGYDEAIRYTDGQLAALYDALEERDLLDETVVVVTSDHGEMLGERGYWGHVDVPFNQQFEVPLFVDASGTGDGSVEELVSGLHLPSMVLDLAGVEPSEEMRAQWVDSLTVDDLQDGTDGRYALVDFYDGALRTKGHDHPELDQPLTPETSDLVDRQRLLVGPEYKLYQFDDSLTFYRYGDTYMDEPVPRSAVPDEVAETMMARLEDLTVQLERDSGEHVDPYADIDDEQVRQQLSDLGYL